MEHAQEAALAHYEAGELDAFVTSFAFRSLGPLARVVQSLPSGLSDKVRRELGRRAVAGLPDSLVKTLPGWEIARTVLAKAGLGPVAVDQIWDAGARSFDRAVARRFVSKTQAIVAFEYTALASFQRAKQTGTACILHLPSLDSRAFKAIEDREQAHWPELKRDSDRYFDGRFSERYDRRCAEIALADVIIANSELTRQSHIAAGADPAKVFVASLGAPPAISEARPARSPDAPLAVVWSGVFSLRKGAHYLLDAWRAFGAGMLARLTVYGEMGLPAPLINALPDSVTFRGSVPRSQMLDAYETADVLIFPTLSDGFGMSVVEALSRGLPVITTDQAGAADLIEHGRNGLIIPAGDPGVIREALQWCLDNRPALAAMRSEALATAKQHQWSDYRRDYLAAVDRGLGAAAHAAGVRAG